MRKGKGKGKGHSEGSGKSQRVGRDLGVVHGDDDNVLIEVAMLSFDLYTAMTDSYAHVHDDVGDVKNDDGDGYGNPPAEAPPDACNQNANRKLPIPTTDGKPHIPITIHEARATRKYRLQRGP